MPTIELAKLAFEVLGAIAEHVELTGTPSERAASAAVVVAVMHHEANRVAKSLQDAGVTASVQNTRTGFELHVGDHHVEVERLTGGFKVEFGGFGLNKLDRQFLPLDKRIQVVAIGALSFQQSVNLGNAVLRKLVAVLKVAA